MTNDANEKIEIELGEKGGKVAVSGSGTSRLINAAADFVSPVTQSLGAVGDFVHQFRLYRETTAAIVLEQTAKRLKERGESPASIPLKMLIQAIEKSSLEEPDNDEMIARWSELLASAANKVQSKDKTIFVDILSRMSAEDALLMDDIAFSPVTNIRALSQLEDAPLSRRHDPSVKVIKTYRDGGDWTRICGKLVLQTEARGSALLRMFVWNEKEANEDFYYSRKGANDHYLDQAVDRLKVLGLVDTVETRTSVAGREASIFAAYLSYVGVEFFYATHDPELEKIPGDRRPGFIHPDEGSLTAIGDTFHSTEELNKLLASEAFNSGLNVFQAGDS